MTEIVYRLDADDRIVEVGGDWNRFAAENGGSDLVPPPLGRSVWDFFAGEEIRLVWSELFARARAGERVEVPFCCDAPGVERDCRIAISAEGGSKLAVTTTILREGSREPLEFRFTDDALGAGVVRACGWCRAFEVDGRWVPVEVAVESLGLLQRFEPPPVSHAICESCASAL